MGSTIVWPDAASFAGLVMKGIGRGVYDWEESIWSTRNGIGRQLANMSPQQQAQYAGALVISPGYAEFINKMKDLEDYGYIEDLGLSRGDAARLASHYREIYNMIQQAIAGKFSDPANYPPGGFPQGPANTQSPVNVPSQQLYTSGGPPVRRVRGR